MISYFNEAYMMRGLALFQLPGICGEKESEQFLKREKEDAVFGAMRARLGQWESLSQNTIEGWVM